MSNNKKNDYLLDKAVNSDDKTTKEKAYCRYIKNVTPTKNLLTNMFKAFIVGGLICAFGQLITNILKESTPYSIILFVNTCIYEK